MKYFMIMVFMMTCGYSSAQTKHVVNWEQGAHPKTVNKWANALNKVSDIGSTTYIRKKSGGEDKLHAMKHRDVVVWIPNSTDLNKPFVTLLWFHGHWGFVEHRTFRDRTLVQIMPYVKERNFVLVLPEMPWSVHTSTPTKRNSQLWLKKGDFLKFVEQVKDILQSHNHGPTAKPDYRVVGHSAGGSTIKRIGITGDLCRLKPSMVVWSDSSYGPWLQLAWDGCLKDHREILVQVFVAKGDAPWLRATQFMNQFKDIQKNLEFHIKKKPRWSHKLIGNNVVKLSGVLDRE